MKLLIAFLVALTAAASAADHPNVLFIMADDIGYGDLSCYGAKHAKTPNLDRLAKEGRKFTSAYSAASTCTPTRRALMTGVYSWRQKAASGILPGDAPLGIQPGSVTLPSLLKQAGYTTGVVGKWHLGLGGPADNDGKGEKANWNAEIKPGPLEIGFDSSFIMAATGDRVPTVYVKDHAIVGLDAADPITVNYQQKIGSEPTGSENPDKLKLKHTHGHDMTIVNGVGRIGWMTGGQSARWRDEDMADVFAREAIAFINGATATKTKPFFLYLATHGIHVPRVPHERFKGVSGHGVRADAIHELDDTVGQVFAALEKAGVMDNTLIMFSSDNGGVMDDGYEDFAPGDYALNGVLRGHKATLLEGGLRVPFLARWPGKVAAGTTSDAMLCSMDLCATLAALTETKIPDRACRDSVNVLPALLGQSEKGRDTYIGHTGGFMSPVAIRNGDWKYIQAGQMSGRKEADRPGAPPYDAPSAKGYLYNLKADISETTNLVEQEPAKLAEMKELLAKAGAPTTIGGGVGKGKAKGKK